MKKDDYLILLLKCILVGILGIFIFIFALFVIGISKVEAADYQSIYLKDNLNQEYLGTTNMNKKLVVCIPNKNQGTECYNNAWVSNWYLIGYYYQKELNYKKGDTVTFEIDFTVEMIAPNSQGDCKYWGMSTIVKTGNRNGTQQTINNRSWKQLTCEIWTAPLTYVAKYQLVGTITPTQDGSTLSFMFPFNNDWTKNSIVKYQINNVVVSADGNDTQTIINNANKNAQEIRNSINNSTTIINGSLVDINSSLTDETAPSDYSFFNDIGLSNDTPISNLVLMPITLLNAINSGFNGSCSSVNLGSLLGHDLILPCIDIQSKIGSNLWSTIDGLISIFLLYEIALMIIGAFEDMTSLNDSYTNLIARHSSENVSYTPRHGGGN